MKSLQDAFSFLKNIASEENPRDGTFAEVFGDGAFFSNPRVLFRGCSNLNYRCRSGCQQFKMPHLSCGANTESTIYAVNQQPGTTREHYT